MAQPIAALAEGTNGSPEFTNEVQHQLGLKVLRWGTNTSSSLWKTGARLPAYVAKGARSGKS
ncbi:MAG: hypothetical protein ABJL55_13570, partial [Roseibium sp.]